MQGHRSANCLFFSKRQIGVRSCSPSMAETKVAGFWGAYGAVTPSLLVVLDSERQIVQANERFWTFVGDSHNNSSKPRRFFCEFISHEDSEDVSAVLKTLYNHERDSISFEVRMPCAATGRVVDVRSVVWDAVTSNPSDPATIRVAQRTRPPYWRHHLSSGS